MRFDAGNHAIIGNGHADIVMICIVAECARHAAAPGLGAADAGAGNGVEHFEQRLFTHQRFLMAMAMHEEMGAFSLQRQCPRIFLQQAGEIFIEKIDVGSHSPRRLAGQQLGIIVADGEGAAGFQTNDRDA